MVLISIGCCCVRGFASYSLFPIPSENSATRCRQRRKWLGGDAISRGTYSPRARGTVRQRAEGRLSPQSCSERRQVSEHRGCRRSDSALLEIAPPLVPQGSSSAHLGRRGGAQVVGGRWMPPERAYKPDRHGAVVAGLDWDASGVWRSRGAESAQS